MKRRTYPGRSIGLIWEARTANFTVQLITERSHEKYDGDDANGEIQAAIDSGEMVYFDSKLVVEFDGEEIGSDYLGSSCYRRGEVSTFVTDGGYFRDMLSTACDEARRLLNRAPKMRAI